MTEIATAIANLNDGLEAMRADFENRLAEMFEALKAATDMAESLKSDQDSHDRQLKQLRERADGQNELIETLTQEAQEAQALRGEVRERDLRIEKLVSELDSKKELVTALRRQAARLDAELKTLTEQASEATSVDNAELAALKSELDARKSMIKSLKADAQRAESLEAQLEAKREAVDALEEAVDQHVRTIAELGESVDAWKAKYQAAKGEKIEESTKTMTELPEFTDTELEALRALEQAHADAPAATVAIDMRDALKEARRQKTSS